MNSAAAAPKDLDGIKQLNAVGRALSREKDPHTLLPLILETAIQLTNADGGSLYRCDGRHLEFECFINRSMRRQAQRGDGTAIPFPTIELYREDGTPNDGLVVTRCALQRKTFNIDDLQGPAGDDFAQSRQLSKQANYLSRSLLAVPMLDHESELLGVLQLVNALDLMSGDTIPFERWSQELVESLASQAAMAMTNHRLVHEFQRLFESMIEMLADAIDNKSAHTGAHCRRVPEIAMALAEAVNQEAEQPQQAGTALHFSVADLYELRVAALLHDCGKVTTPVHVIDKATKLEAIIDRIAGIRDRLQLWKCVVREEGTRRTLNLHEKSEATPEAVTVINRDIAKSLARIEEIGRFLERCNQAQEPLTEADRARLIEIGDIRIQPPGESSLPLIDHDELQNLLIARGTLNEEERKTINDHVVQTAMMLQHLPFPKKLAQVPEIASNHHERIDGKGYPCGLTGDQMSVQAKIMAIADVFEALTASDRPYRPAMSLSRALKILKRMADEGHLDPGLTEIFLRQRAYVPYARTWMARGQIDVELDQTAIADAAAAS